MKYIIASILSFLSWTTFAQQAPSPEKFLGYAMGEKFTPHHKILDYFHAVANSQPATVKIEEYGKTYEGRSLIVTYISAPKNIERLEEIRKNNLQLARFEGAPMVRQKNTNVPAIVWLSYNVHGNEPSCSEAAMMTLYALAAPQDQTVASWLENTLIIIDPCLNPDGRERYVNWYQSVAGPVPNPDPSSREHNEPWPGGRSNHYNFDLNRDWAWQSQQESQLRAAIYNKWMPQIHVDFHEQFFNSPYYFAPAAEPFHEVITPWQRSFQTEIGKNHASYFDKNGWLYFTRELFDLFYPSYGDTWPMYNGAIGMTYEQAGHSRAGLAVITEDGDTLTLKARAQRHFTTGMSTIEVVTKHATQLVEEFAKFFDQAVEKGYGPWQSYVLKNNPENKERIAALKVLLDRNGIQYGYAAAKSVEGFHYFDDKQGRLQLTENDLVIPSKQPRSAMVRVLFEPKTFLPDSATYDITAWAIPYVYGIDAVASKSAVPYSHYPTVTDSLPAILPAAYAYAIPWTGTRAAAVLGALLQKGIKVRYAQEPFTIQQQPFQRGTLLITKAGNRHFESEIIALLTRLSEENNVAIHSLFTGYSDKGFDIGSEKMKLIGRTNVTLLTGNKVGSIQAGEIWHYFEQDLQYPINLVNTEDLMSMKWDQMDVLIIPENSTTLFSNKQTGGRLKEWVQNGGRLIAIENAVSQLAEAGWGIKEKKDSKEDADSANTDPYKKLMKFGDKEKEDIKNGITGAIFKVNLDNTHPLAFGFPEYYFTLKQHTRNYSFLDNDGWNVGVLKSNNYVAGFAGYMIKPNLKDGLEIGVQPIGKGEVVYLSDDPMFRSFWENGKLLLSNAVFLAGH